MITWTDFTRQAPHVAEIFLRRHRAAHDLCLLATIRADGSPRISPMEPRVLDDHLVLVGMPGTTKFRDLDRDPRFCLHTATVDPQVGDGDAKLFGQVHHLPDEVFHQRFAEDVYDDIGLDLRGQVFDPFYVADLTSASSLELVDDQLRITIWKPGEGERTVLRR